MYSVILFVNVQAAWYHKLMSCNIWITIKSQNWPHKPSACTITVTWHGRGGVSNHVQLIWLVHDDIKWKHFLRYWPFVRRIRRSSVKSPSKGQRHRAFSLRLNERLSKQSWGWWFETPTRRLWRHRNEQPFRGSWRTLLALCDVLRWWPVDSPHGWLVMREPFPCYDALSLARLIFEYGVRWPRRK